ncbi:unnamed protein product [Durusdinium trenchii]|uniref:Uncharacterized protein n=1 Tax=Durusdinium trenchii TaxID=1381693 RepID=A0ABP0S1A3_9DINO
MPREDGNENDEIVDENSQEVNINVICGQTKVLQMSASSTLADAGQNVFPGQPPWIVTKFVVDEKVVDGASLVSSLGGRPLTIIREQKYCNSKKELPLRCSHANLHPQLNKVEDLAFF